MKSIILIAPPSAGKGTISKIINEKYHLPHISTGDLLRSAIETGDEQGNYIKEQMNSGKLVSDSIIMNLIENKIKSEECQNGYILDGFPRNISQAKAYEELLKRIGKELGFVILLDISCENAKKRILGRVSCSACGAVYNIYSPDTRPRVVGICDKCGNVLSRRQDDNEEVFEQRFKIYMDETKPVIDYFKSKNLLYEIDSSVDLSIVIENVEKIISLENNL